MNRTHKQQAPTSAPQDSNIPTRRSTGTAKLVLFDFDGTITTKDTLLEFVRFYRGRKKFLLGMLMLVPVMALFALKVIPNWKAKQFFLAQFFKGEKLVHFDTQCILFSTRVLPTLIRAEAKKAIAAYRRQAVTIAVVSASAENWIKPWCDQNGLVCLATRLEAVDGIITGRFKGRNCYGDEKVCRIREQFNLTEFDEIIAYGDSRGDREMLALAQRRYYKPFRKRV